MRTQTEVNQALAVLDNMAALINTPDRWTQNAYARAAGGFVVNPNEQSAVCWCLAGAYSRIAKASFDGRAWQALCKVTADPIGWQDTPNRTHAEVIDLLARARQFVQ